MLCPIMPTAICCYINNLTTRIMIYSEHRISCVINKVCPKVDHYEKQWLMAGYLEIFIYKKLKGQTERYKECFSLT